MKIETFACDQCKTHKKDANHWFRAWKSAAVSCIVVIEWDGQLPFEMVPTGTTPNEPFHLCGAACVSQWVSQNLL